MTQERIAGSAVNGFSRKNVLINGNFDIWQRGTSQSAGGYGSADRWRLNIQAGDGGAATLSQKTFGVGQTNVPGEPRFSIRHDQTSSTTSLNPNTMQRIEDVRTLAGRTVSLSFHAKASKAISVTPKLQQVFGSGGSPSANVEAAFAAQSITTAWQKFTVSVSVPSLAGKVIGTTAGTSYLQMFFELPAADTYQFDFAKVQLEDGPTATDFEERSIAEELSLCHRYYQRLECGAFAGLCDTATRIGMSAPFTTEMRAVPSVVNLGNAISMRVNGGNKSSTAGSFTTSTPTTKSFHALLNGFTGLTQGQGTCGRTTAEAFSFDAEL